MPKTPAASSQKNKFVWDKNKMQPNAIWAPNLRMPDVTPEPHREAVALDETFDDEYVDLDKLVLAAQEDVMQCILKEERMARAKNKEKARRAKKKE